MTIVYHKGICNCQLIRFSCIKPSLVPGVSSSMSSQSKSKRIDLTMICISGFEICESLSILVNLGPKVRKSSLLLGLIL